jgi:hypothetical protein
MCIIVNFVEIVPHRCKICINDWMLQQINAFVGSEVLKSVVMQSSVFWDMMCSLLKVNWRV